MTALSITPFPFFPWLRRTVEPNISKPTPELGDSLRREYVTNMMSSGACCGEYGAMALMSVFPKGFLMMIQPRFQPEDVLHLWFPETDFWETEEGFSAWIRERMYGGMDETICRDFAELTEAAARGELDHWAHKAEGCVALLIALNQFPRSLWRDTPAAYAQDIKANHLVFDGVRNGHFSAVKPWKKLFCIIAVGHCEGVDHLDRLTRFE